MEGRERGKIIQNAKCKSQMWTFVNLCGFWNESNGREMRV
jgi:hypothetical protein